MVEEVKFEEDKLTSAKTKKKLIVGAYVWNFNLYLISLLSFSHWVVRLTAIIVLNTYAFKNMFGITRFTRVAFWNLVVGILFLWNFEFATLQVLFLIVTTIVNLGYYFIVLDDGKRYKKIINRA